VIHAAGVLQFEPLATQDVGSFFAGVAAKVLGAWRLHCLLRDEPLDCFVVCSSSSALLSSPLLGGYAAGNAFLDALAHHRRAGGKRALSVNWGTWGEVGMAVEAGRSASGAMLSGLGTIPTARGLDALHELLRAECAQAAVMPIDWTALARAYPAFAHDPFFAQLVRDMPAEGPIPEQEARRWRSYAWLPPSNALICCGPICAAKRRGCSACRSGNSIPTCRCRPWDWTR